MALALSPLIANAESVIKLLMKDKTTQMKQDETDDKQKGNNQIATIRQICDYLESLKESGQLSGAVLVTKGDDDIRFGSGYGFSNYELEICNTPTTKFRIASLTKLFTATAIMQLVEKGLLSLTDPLSKFIPNFPRAKEITIHHLLTHTSGIVNYTTLPEYEDLKIKPTAPEKMIALIQNKKLDFTPGDKFSYSNSGYTILTHIIEKVTELSYSEYLQENIFKPLAMQDTGYDDQNIVLKNRASGYIKDDSNTLKNAPYRDMSLLAGAGGLYSTVEDLYKFHRGLTTSKILKKESITMMFRRHKDDHCYGWDAGSICGLRVFYSIGGMSGFSSIFMHFPDIDMCITILSNFGFTNAEKIAHDVAEVILNQSTKAAR